MPETAEQYIGRILGYVEGQDAIKVQRTTAAKLKKSIQGLSAKQLKWRPEPAKWSISEIMAHLADAEVVASWRMRSVIGENGITIQPFDQDAWASAFEYRDRDARRSLEFFRVLRENNLAMLKEISRESAAQITHDLKYDGYVSRQQQQVARQKRLAMNQREIQAQTGDDRICDRHQRQSDQNANGGRKLSHFADSCLAGQRDLINHVSLRHLPV